MKRYFVGFILTAGVFSASAATIIGSDDFNDNVVDHTKWQQTDAEGSAGFTEDNQQLEYISGSTGFEFIEWTWTGGNPSYSQDWAVQVDFDLVYFPQQISDSHFFGLTAGGNGYSFDLHYASYYNQAYLETDVLGPGDTDISDTESEVSSSSVTLKISFDATTKMLHSSYSSGGGFIALSSYSAASFGMTDSSTFTLKLQGESSGMVMNLDDAVFDNFVVTQSDASTEIKELNDDFNDDSRNTDLWDVFRVSAEREWVEQNGRLEAISTAGVYERDAGVWEWTGPKPAFDENWTVTFDATINVAGTASGSSTWIGFVAADPTLSNTVTVEQWVQDGIRGVDAGAKTNGIDLGEVNELISSNTVTLRVNYDSGKKELHASYDDGSGYWNFLASRSVTNWGMTDADDFRILIFGGSEEDGLVSGDAYGDNFKFKINNIESDPQAIIPSQSIVGSWYIQDKGRPSHDNVVLSFLTNGVYFMCQDGDLSTEPPGAVGYDGMEMGTYTWDPVTQQLSNVVIEDTNAEWGLSDDPASNTPFAVENNQIYAGDRDVDPFVLHRVVAQTSPASLVGSWVVGDDEVVITFLHNGIYYLSHADPFGNADASGYPGMERGIYTWDSETGAFTAMALVDTTGDWGLDGGSPSPGMTISVSGNTATFNIPDEGPFEIQRVVAPDCSDIDADGLPDAFELQISGNPTNAVPGGNSDSDDLTDREEYIAGTLPNDGTSVFAVSNAPPSPAGHVLTWNAIPSRIYTVEWTDALTNSFQILETGITHPQNSYTDTVHTAEEGGFYNLKVELDD